MSEHERFTPQSVERDIDALLAAEPRGDDARLTHALAALYAPPEGANATLARVQARVRAAARELPEVSSVPSPARGATLREVTAQAPTTGRRHSSPRRHARSNAGGMRAALGALAAVLVVALVAGGFVYVFQGRIHTPATIAKATATTQRLLGTPTPLPTVGPAALPVPGTPASWQTYAVPVPFVQQQTELGLAVSPTDGATAYICNPVTLPDATQQPQIWVTHDRGAQWSHLSDLPTLGSVAECSLDVDELDGAHLVALLSGQNLHTLASFTDYFASSDGGATWAMVAQGVDFNVEIQHIATNQGKTYAIYTKVYPWPANTPTPTADPSQPYLLVANVHIDLAVSSDGLHTWQPVDSPILALVGPKQYVKQYWARVGADGQMNLLADVGTTPLPNTHTAPPPDTLWVSHDGGAHWIQLPAPQVETFLAQASSDGRSWYICGTNQNAYSQPLVDCSYDGGETWAARPLLRTCETCPGQPILVYGNAITNDGSLIGIMYENKSVSALYALPANSSQWQYLGNLPQTNDTGFIYAPSPGAGMLWVYGGSASGNDLSATIGGTGDATGVFYTAAYPE